MYDIFIITSRLWTIIS